MEWTPEQYRSAYHFNRFTAGWRQLLVFYVAMTLAGYAQVIHSFIFYAAWGELVLMYWEPYLSPPFPWTSDSPIKDGFDSALLTLRLSSAAVEREELAAIKQYVLAIQRGLNETQLRVYKVLFGAIIIPYCFLVVGVAKQASLPQYSSERQAVYASALLLALMSVYVVSVGVCLWIFHCVQQQESEESRAAEVDWQPHDMMFFMCKILGETLNTVVQTLVAGSFTAYMPWPVFWLCICITGLSYTATNLLYDFDDNPPITDDPRRPSSCLPTRKPTYQPHQHHHQQQQQQQQQQQPQKHLSGSGADVAALADTYPSSGCDVTQPVDDSAQLPVVLSAPADLRGRDFPTGSTGSGNNGSLVDAGGSACLTTEGRPTALDCIEDAEAPFPAATACTGPVRAGPAAPQDTCNNPTAAAAAGGRVKPWQSFNARLQARKQRQPKKTPSPPFLKYKWPKGLRGRSIVWLLLGVSVPSLLLLVLVGRGIAAGTPELFLEDPKGDCRAAGEACLERYVQLLVILCCLGCLISYYAFTIGFLGAGPVTWLYQVLKQQMSKQQAVR